MISKIIDTNLYGNNLDQSTLCRTSDGVYHCIYSKRSGGAGTPYIIYHAYADSDDLTSWTTEIVTSAHVQDDWSPVVVCDSNDELHVIYIYDDNTNYLINYTYTISGVWQTPVTISAAVTTAQPTLAIDSNDYLHAA